MELESEITTQSQDKEQELNHVVDTATATAVKNLSSGVLAGFESELTAVSKELKDFTDQQDTLIEKMSSYNNRTETSHVFPQLKDAMDLIYAQMERLNLIKQDMTTFQERSQKLRVRAEKLRSRVEDKERRDEDLVAQLVGSGDHKHKEVKGHNPGPIPGVETKVELGL